MSEVQTAPPAATPPAVAAISPEEELMMAVTSTAACREPSEILYGNELTASLQTALKPLELELPASSNPGGALVMDRGAASAAVDGADAYSVLVARRMATVIHMLNPLLDPAAAAATLSPRAHLMALMEAVRVGLFLSFPEPQRAPVVLGDGGGGEARTIPQLFRLHVSNRQIGTAAMWEGLYTLTYPSTRLRVEMASLVLRQRLQRELEAVTDEAAMSSLMVTETLLDDFAEIYHNVLLAIPMHAQHMRELWHPPASLLASSSARVPLTLTERSVASLASTLGRYFYQLSDWVLLLESTAEVPPVSLTRATRLTLDDRKGVVEVHLRRPSAESPWGLLLSDQLRLVDVDVSLRVHERMNTLHQLLRSSRQGAEVLAINDTPLPKRTAAAYREVFAREFQAASAHHKQISLTLRSPEFRGQERRAPTEVAFYRSAAQAGEGGSGQRVSLVLHRCFLDTDWQFRVDQDFYFIPPQPQPQQSSATLSPEVREFLKQYRRRLRLVAVNGIAVQSLEQVDSLVATVELVHLDLLVVPHTMALSAKQQVPAPAPDAALPSPPAQAEQPPLEAAAALPDEPFVDDGEPEAGEPVEAPPAASTDSIAADDLIKEAVAKVERQAAASEPTVQLASAPVDDEEYTRTIDEVVDAVIAQAEPAAPTVLRTGDATADAVLADFMSKQHDGESQPLRQGTRDAPVVAATAAAKPKPTAAAKAEAAAAVPQVVEDIIASLMKGSGKDAVARKTSPKTKAAAPEKAAREESGAAAEAVEFDNGVQLLKLTDTEMELRRPSESVPWGMRLQSSSDTSANPGRLPLQVLQLPSLPKSKQQALQQHPFIKKFNESPDPWFIYKVNNRPATGANDAINTMKKNLSLKLKFLRK